MHMYICVYGCRRATVDKQLWGDLANKNGPELTPEIFVRVQLMMSVMMYVCICMHNTCFDVILLYIQMETEPFRY